MLHVHDLTRGSVDLLDFQRFVQHQNAVRRVVDDGIGERLRFAEQIRQILFEGAICHGSILLFYLLYTRRTGNRMAENGISFAFCDFHAILSKAGGM